LRPFLFGPLSACFSANDDYLFYLDTLAELCDELRIRLHAYCLMHLLLTPEAGESVSALMKHLGQLRRVE